MCSPNSFVFKLKSFIIGNCQQTINYHNKFDVKINYRNDNQQKQKQLVRMKC